MNNAVAVVGEGVIDRFIRPDGITDVIGGSPLNTAVALRRAGVDRKSTRLNSSHT